MQKTTMSLRDQEVEKLVEARNTKQRYTKGGLPLGKTPEQKQEEALKAVCTFHKMDPTTAEVDYEAKTITGVSYDPRFQEEGKLDNVAHPDSPAQKAAAKEPATGIVPSSSIEADPTHRLDAKNYLTQQPPSANTALIPLTEQEQLQIKVFGEMYGRCLAVLQICNDQQVQDEQTKALGFSVAKQTDTLIKELDARRLELNKAPQKDISDRNALVKKLSAPLEAGLATIKKRLTDYQVQQEEQRLKDKQELEKKQEEQRLKDEAEKARIQKINTSIQDFRQKSDTEIAAIETTEQLDTFIKKITGWGPKAEYYQEFYNQIVEEKKAAIARAEGRRTVVGELEKAKAAAEAASKKGAAEKAKADAKLKQLEQEKAQAAQREQQEKIKQQEQAKQHEATCRLTITSKLQLIGWPASELEAQLKYVVDIYGDFTTAVDRIMDFGSRMNIRFQEYQEQLTLQSQKAKNLRTTWKYKVTDLSLVPREYLQLDEKKLTNYLSSKKEAIKSGAPDAQIPGIEFYSDTAATLAS